MAIDQWRLINAAELVEPGIGPDWRDSEAPLRLEKEKQPRSYQPRGAEFPAFLALLNEELQEGIITPMPEDRVKWINPTFLVPKKGGQFRKILDCRRLNREIKDHHFRMDGVEELLLLLQPNDWATSLDFRSAFNHIPVHPDLQPYLCFQVSRTTYCYQGMPFGIKHAPRVFTRVMKAAVREARRRWNVRMLSYMDDSILLFNNATTAQAQTAEIATYFQSLGWTLALNKCQMVPTQITEFLGWNWNLRDRQLTIPVKRQNALLAELKRWIDKARRRESSPIKEVAALLGRLSHLRFQILEASLYMRRTIHMMSRARAGTTWAGNCTLTPEILGELKWWASRISKNAPRRLIRRRQTLLITTDASPSGWGAELVKDGRTIYTFGRWNRDECQYTSNAKELTAVRKALRQAARLKVLSRGSEVLVRSDNTTTVFLIKRWSACLSLVSHLRQLFNLTRKRDILLTATYLPGVLNSTADKLSRLGSAMDFSLNRETFLLVTQELHLEPEIDVFADAENHLCDAYASLSPRDGAAIAVDGLTIPWTNRALWLHPPINLISRVLAKLETERTRAILVAPAWEGQPWSPRLTQHALRHYDLGSYEECMVPGKKFQEEGWLFPPGRVRASLLDTRTTPEKSS
jgi:ribonuclease HI